MEEIWKPVRCLEGKYEVSNLGSIKSIARKNRHEDLIRKISINRYGYRVVSLNLSGKVISKRVARMVAEAFIPRLPEQTEVNHKDGNKLNDSDSNLEWCTRLENEQHCWKTGLKNYKGVNHYACKFKEEDIRFIRKSKESLKELGKKFSCDGSTIGDIRRRKTWKHIN
jgi:hypothetical protein